jgi:hypothetical protein
MLTTVWLERTERVRRKLRDTPKAHRTTTPHALGLADQGRRGRAYSVASFSGKFGETRSKFPNVSLNVATSVGDVIVRQNAVKVGATHRQPRERAGELLVKVTSSAVVEFVNTIRDIERSQTAALHFVDRNCDIP